MSLRRAAERRGRGAERLAAALLRAKGYRILARRFRSPAGEVDLVAARGRVLAFVEVKRRATSAEAAEAVTAKSRIRIARAAEHFIIRHPQWADRDLRFDAVLVGRFLPRHLSDAWRP